MADFYYFLGNGLAFLCTFTVFIGSFVNGWTDAPNAITACVASKALPFKRAALMAGICNFLGAFVFCFINNDVALTVFNITKFGGNQNINLKLIISALMAVNVWSVFAEHFGIPTSESHGLLAALSGAGVFINKSLRAVNFKLWFWVIAAMVSSAALGLVLSLFISKIFNSYFSCNKANKRLLIFSSALLSFMHGAQDSQKFAGILMLVLYNVQTDFAITPKIFTVLLTGFFIAMGSFVGGKKIIDKLGGKMVSLNINSGLFSNLASTVSVFLASLLGMSVSTTHVCAFAHIGASLSAKKRVSLSDTLQLIFFWGLTFPACFIISIIICYLII